MAKCRCKQCVKGIPCDIEGCDAPRVSRGWCHKHYTRWQRHGDPHHVKLIVGDDERRFWSHVVLGDDCWGWIGHFNNKGYPTFSVNDRSVYAHRYAYELLVGPIPEGLELDHLCRNPACPRPSHLEPVTHHENMLRGKPATKTHCVHGHLYDEQNTKWTKSGHRSCRTCTNDRRRLRTNKGWKKACIHCGGTFYSQVSNRRTCSDVCQRARRLSRVSR